MWLLAERTSWVSILGGFGEWIQIYVEIVMKHNSSWNVNLSQWFCKLKNYASFYSEKESLPNNQTISWLLKDLLKLDTQGRRGTPRNGHNVCQCQ